MQLLKLNSSLNIGYLKSRHDLIIYLIRPGQKLPPHTGVILREGFIIR